MTNATQKLIDAAQAALEWITDTGLGNSEEVASRFHLEMKGYRPAEHAQVDADLSAGCAAAESLRTALAAARQEAAAPEVRAAPKDSNGDTDLSRCTREQLIELIRECPLIALDAAIEALAAAPQPPKETT